MVSRAGAQMRYAVSNTVHGEAGDFGCAGIPATADQLPGIRRGLAAWAQRVGANEELIDVVVLAVYEAMANVVAHAYPRGPGTFDVRAAYRPERGLRVTVSDRGRWQPPLTSNGKGLRLINALAARSSVDPCTEGTIVQMSWPLLSGAPAG